MQKLFVIIFSFLFVSTHAQQELPLYGKDSIPNSKLAPDEEQDMILDSGALYVAKKVSRPTLSVYQPAPETRNGTAVIICPGGAYMRLSMYAEGIEVAEWLTKFGITAFVLKYRLPSDETMLDKTVGPLQDAQRAIQIIRERAKVFGVDSNKVGIIGFSAGGHLGSTVGTHYLQATIDNKNNVSLRPDFMILLYPVISLVDSICHKATRESLLGLHPDTAKVLAYSNERQVTAQTPPTFIIHAENDNGVPVVNSIYFYEGLIKNHVRAELLIYPQGGHGFGIHNRGTNDQWTDRLMNWLEENGWLGLSDRRGKGN